MNIGARNAVLTAALIALLAGGFLAALPGTARAEDRAQIDSLFGQAKDLWERGRAAEAAQVLKQLLAADPSQETAYDLLRKAEYQMFLDMLKEGGDSELVAKRLLDLAYREEQVKTKDESAIRELAGQAIHGQDYGERQKAVRTLVARYGEFSVPALYGYLGSNDTNERVYAILALSELGSSAVLPLTEVLNSDDYRIQQNAALVLQKIGDVRAIGGLHALAAHASNPAVKEVAAQAALSLGMDAGGCSCDGGACGGCKMGKGDMTAAQAYMWLGLQYYKRDARVIKNYLDGYTLWDWKDGKLADRQVPRYMYHLELAEESCYDALGQDEGNQMARDMLAAVHYAEWGTLQGLSAEARESDEVKALADRVWNVLNITASQGADTQLGALGLGLKWNDANIAIGALHALPKVWDGRALTADSPLVMALDAENKTIRFAAAIAALRIQPASPFPGSEKVVPIAAQAADTGSVRQVLIVEPSAETQAKALRAIEAAAMFAVAESTAMDAFRRAKDVATFDVIVIRANLDDALALAIVKDLREDFRTAAVPILISGQGSELDAAKELFGTNVQGYISADPIDVEAVKSAASGSLNDDQVMALHASQAACDALAMIVKEHTAFPNYADAENALVGVVKSEKPDEIRLAALKALGVIGSAKSVGALVDAFKQTANATPVRVGTAMALGKVLAGMAAPANAFDALLGGLGDEAREVRQAAGTALGEMKLTSAQQNQVLMQYRVE